MEEAVSASKYEIAKQFPRYSKAVLGLREYWYPVMFSSRLRRRPKSRTLLGERVMLLRREDGKVVALHDRCPHRGIPLSVDPRREFPGTISCGYHGWTFDLETGKLVAAITDGPDSPICGKVSVRTYPVEERAGLIWIYMGDREPPPVETDIPGELLHPDAVVEGSVHLRKGNWRFPVEGGIDEGHAKYQHRTSPWMFFRQLPTWSKVRMARDDDGWLIRIVEEAGFETDFPGLGRWPKTRRPWQARGRNAVEVGANLPGQLRARQWGWTEFVFVVPVDPDHHYVVLLGVKQATGRDRLLWKLRYRTYIAWLYHGHLNGVQDAIMAAKMEIPPERLYRPDISITSWRRMCEREARDFLTNGDTPDLAPDADEVDGDLVWTAGEPDSRRNGGAS